MSLAWFLPLPGSYAGVDAVGVYNFACSLREVLAKHPFLPQGCGLVSGSHFPSFSEGLSLRLKAQPILVIDSGYFPSFSEGLSLRPRADFTKSGRALNFPSFSEGLSLRHSVGTGTRKPQPIFPFLFGGTFIEALNLKESLTGLWISLPFRRDFH